MRVRGKGATLTSGEGSSPPLPFITVSDDEGRALIRLGVAEAVDGEPAEEVEPDAEPALVQAPAGEPAADAVVEPAADQPPAEADKRRAEIVEAIELLDPEADYVKTGDRAGRPKVKSVEEILGYDVTMAEVDEALASREAAE